jgi:6-phosphogluconolactonase (cycloisomerase 2 family)
MGMQAFVHRMGCLALSLALFACGGGGSDGGGTPTPKFTIGGTVKGLASGESVTLENNGGNALTVSGNTSFVFSTPVLQHGSYSVTVMTQPLGQICTVTSASGSDVTANVTSVAVVCATPAQYAYVVNQGSNSISQFAIGTSGNLTALATATVPTGRSPQSVAVDPTHRFVYVTNLTDDTVSQYIIQQDGTLEPNSPATVATGHGPWALAVSPSGDWAYVVNSKDNTISQFVINSSGGLVASSVGPVKTGTLPWNLTLSPNGEFAYVSNHGTSANPSATVSQYSIDATSGALTALNPATVLTASNFPAGIAVDADSAYAYVANLSVGSVSQYAIGTDGTLTSLSPSFVSAGTQPVYVAIHPGNRYAYVANNYVYAIGTVSQYTIGTTGALTPMAKPSVMAGPGPGWIAFDVFGHYAYVVNIGDGASPGSVSAYSIDSTGALTLIGTTTVGVSPFAIATI